MKYLLDANVFIQAHRFHYPMDLFPTFGELLEGENEKKRIFSIHEIYDGLQKGKDELWKWVERQNKESWFLSASDEETQKSFTEIGDWIEENKQYKEGAKKDFLDTADPWLIAKAYTEKFTVVTQEKSNPDSKRKIFIPDVCTQFKVVYIDTVELMRKLGGKF